MNSRLMPLSVALLVLLPLTSHAKTAPKPSTPPALAHATAIAKRSPMIQGDYVELKAEARKIRDPKLRSATLAILGGPVFELSSRRPKEASIRQALLAHKLLDLKTAPPHIIPLHPPMPFYTAPGSTWTGHHCFPGGLVIHTLTNLKHSLSLARDWVQVNHITMNWDWLRAAPIWHDVAKTWSIQWKADGSSTPDEGKIAGTDTHHILSVAEALMRGLSPEYIVTQASAHSPPTPGAGLKQLIGYLQAASIIAGKPYTAAGLTPDGSRLAKPAPLEAFIHHLSDHDWVASIVTSKEAQHAISVVFGKKSSFWPQDEFLSRFGDLKIIQVWRQSGAKGLRSLVHQSALSR